ncbi:MAG: RnfABCDGE type electron transport complex subunit D [Bacilli bacterium]|nr:RnfABCDGE type electron transport complex subunit D [Bacilli bacterium]
MKEFKVRKGNFLKSKNSTSNMMYNILIVLVPFIIFSTFKNGIYPIIKGYGNLYLAFKPLLYVVIPALVCIIVEYIFYTIKKDKKSFYELFTKSYAIIPGVFLGLIISINTSIYMLVIGAIIASLSKLLMGGFGKNKLNPALVGALFITVIFSSLTGGYLNPYEIDTISSATPLSNMTASSYVVTYDNIVSPYGSLLTFLFGNIPGAIGETCSFLCIIALIYLSYKKIIKWRIPVSYILSVAVISLIICLTKDIGLWFILFNLLSGGLLFGAVFMATDPVTSPISHLGQVVGGIILGIITMIIRYLTPLPEGVLISILIYNLLTIVINNLTIKLYGKRNIRLIILITTILVCILSSFIISKNITNKPLDDTYNIISKEKVGNTTVYQVSGIGYAGKNSIKLKIVFENDSIKDIEIISNHETYINMIYDNNYLDKIISNQNNLDELDTISGCTYTSKYLKEIVEKTKQDYSR